MNLETLKHISEWYLYVYSMFWDDIKHFREANSSFGAKKISFETRMVGIEGVGASKMLES